MKFELYVTLLKYFESMNFFHNAILVSSFLTMDQVLDNPTQSAIKANI